MSEPTVNPQADGAPLVKWQACPALQSPGKSMFALVVVAGLAWGTVSLSGSPLAGLAAAIGVILVLHRFFFPSTHTIDDQGVTVATLLGTKRLAWNQINHVSHDATRVYVSTRSRRGSDGGRGLLLLLKDNQAEVLAAIASRRQPRA